MDTWRVRAIETIRGLLIEHNPQTLEEFDRVMFDGYPFGVRQHTPYKVWLEEVRKQRAAFLGHKATPEHVKRFWIDAQ